MVRALIAAAAVLALGACASTANTETASNDSARDCFRAGDVSRYGIEDEHRIRATVNSSREYFLTIRQRTNQLDWANAITLRAPTSFICTGNGLGVQVIGGNPEQTYYVERIERAPQTAPAGS